MNNQHQINGHLERKVLLLVTRNAIIIVLTYLILYLIGVVDPYVSWSQCVIATFIYGGIHWLIRTNFSNLVKRSAALLLMVSVTVGFFFQGGFYGVSSLDICCLILVLPVIFQGKERSFFIFLFILQIISLGFIQIFYPWLISKAMGDLGIVFVLEAMVRCGNMMYMGYMYKCEYEKEQARIVSINRQLEYANEHIACYNIELEKLINHRTKIITTLNEKLFEFAFFNSHKVRGPLARIIGLVSLIKGRCSSNECSGIRVESEYIDKLHVSADELDKIIKQINVILDNRMYVITGPDQVTAEVG